MKRRQFNQGLAAAGTLAALSPFGIVRAQSSKLKVGVLLPRSGVQALIGQSCQRGADLAPEVIRQLLGVDIEIMNADTESNADTARRIADREATCSPTKTCTSRSAPWVANTRQPTPSTSSVRKPLCTRSPPSISGHAGALAERSTGRPSWKTWKATLGA